MKKIEYWKEIVNFINSNGYNDKSPFSSSKILTKKTSLENNLGITADDGVEFLEAFFEKFPIDTSDIGSLGYYFQSEGFQLFSFSKNIEILPLTLGMLEHALMDGVWDSKKLDKYAKDWIKPAS